MKFHSVLHSAAAWLLLPVLLLSLTGCGKPPVEPTQPAPTETSPTQTEPDALTQLRQDLGPAIAGVLYLGFEENGLPSPGDLADRYPVLAQVDTAIDAGGYELYCIFPADPQATVEVHQWDANTVSTGDTLYQGDGAPFLLLCNVSDIMPNTVVTIVDSQGGMLELYSPSLSLRDGCVLLPEGGLVADLTEY